MRLTPKISDSPQATINSDEVPAIPLRNSTARAVKSMRGPVYAIVPDPCLPLEPFSCCSLLRAHFSDLRVIGLNGCAIDISYVGHDAFAVLDPQFANIRAK